MGYTQATATQMTLLAEEKITKTKPASVPIYRVTLVRDGRVSCYNQQIRSAVDASTLLHTYLADVDREHFVVLLLDQKNKVIGIHTVSIGSLRGYPETFSHCHNEIKQPPCGNETRGDRRERV